MKDWITLAPGWKAAFSQAWFAWRAGTVPIGAAILNREGAVMSLGHNAIYAPDDDAPIHGHTLAHAETNAILRLNEHGAHPDIRTYTLYTTMEPCPLCLGAIVIGSIRHFCYAARDPYGGAVELLEKSAYIQGKGIRAEGPQESLEAICVAIQACWDITRRGRERAEGLLTSLRATCPQGVDAAIALHHTGALDALARQGAEAADAYACIRETIELG